VVASRRLELGREAYARRSWRDAHESLSAADRAAPLAPADLELLATSAFMRGQDHEYVNTLERAHDAYLQRGEPLRAFRCAFWCGMILMSRGEVGPGSAWIGRAQRLCEGQPDDSVERGYLLMPLAFRHEAAGEFEAAAAVAGEAAAIAERFGEVDGFALASFTQGSMLIKAGRVPEGLAVLDEAMLTAVGGDLSPMTTGIVYCGVILACQEVFEARRAQEWTAVLTEWCEGQPDVVAFTGRCLVHRAEILQLGGAWPDALEEARKARQRFIDAENLGRVGLALYREAELQRLLGDFEAAEQAYREASRHGWDPQPGLAQLRLARGRVDAAVASIQRVLAESSDSLKRAGLLPACVEIMLTAGDIDAAVAACCELEELVGRFESTMLGAMVARARGAVELARGDPLAALGSLRPALEIWQELEAPYEVARARELIGLACRALGDEEAAKLELDAARATFEELRAAPDSARVAASIAPAGTSRHGLSARELEVLRLVAAGRSNREIAVKLVISEHTVARHLQNIFGKLDVSSRTAAASFAFEHGLV
jgi:DNA-binding CsgD family transcriptional regulator